MKKLLLLTILMVLKVSFAFAQESTSLPSWRTKQISELVSLIRNNQVQQLADLIEYPLRRENPIPDIKSKENFILHYPTLFDTDFKIELITTVFNTDNTIDRSNGFGLLNGEVWLNEDGKIIAINHHSASELQLKEHLTKESRGLIHPSINQWKENILVCKTGKFLIRIDRLENNSLRYVAWSINKGISEKPDLVLFNGKRIFHGTSGGVSYSFTNSEWNYQLDKSILAERIENTGLFLRIFKGNDEVASYSCKEIK
ncbi:hypothetical protein [Nafulsella turpanensis]|uniref:hypothetical protein n=1 Tax=Nafulsella turpanensis TaxID=1265690 RepID=UPI000349995B|nr:hypothetical protein [Nafulsella turpanensis]